MFFFSTLEGCLEKKTVITIFVQVFLDEIRESQVVARAILCPDVNFGRPRVPGAFGTKLVVRSFLVKIFLKKSIPF